MNNSLRFYIFDPSGRFARAENPEEEMRASFKAISLWGLDFSAAAVCHRDGGRVWEVIVKADGSETFDLLITRLNEMELVGDLVTTVVLEALTENRRTLLNEFSVAVKVERGVLWDPLSLFRFAVLYGLYDTTRKSLDPWTEGSLYLFRQMEPVLPMMRLTEEKPKIDDLFRRLMEASLGEDNNA